MKQITLIPGDGIGKEISKSLIEIFEFMDIPIEFEVENAGYKEFLKNGNPLPDSLYKSIEKNKIAIKGPTTTQIGSGYRSINVYLRKKYDLYTNIREVKSLENTLGRYENIDLTIFRENTEGLYIGDEEILEEGENKTVIARKKITRKGSIRIIRKAFQYANLNNKKKVTVAHKANILKECDGLFLECAREVSKNYPTIELEEVIIDNMCMQLVMYPEKYGVIVTMNLYGDILSDLCAGLIGGLGLAPGSNIGDDIAIFEPVHGSAPDIAGRNIANPTAILLSSVQMLKYLNMEDYAKKLENAIINLYKEGKYLTKDLGGTTTTDEFTKGIIEKLGD
ncbi:MAG: isocitrate/isopropylmalate dehydrogenase family protein [Lachnospirales bacterium]